MWGGLFSTFDCALLAIRQKDDPINPIMSGAITGGVLAARGQSAKHALGHQIAARAEARYRARMCHCIRATLASLRVSWPPSTRQVSF
jgi:hypothetical protein|eukprot:COSAG06_NODE_5480_length_3453_cov_1.630590_3_plen_88_part_00